MLVFQPFEVLIHAPYLSQRTEVRCYNIRTFLRNYLWDVFAEPVSHFYFVWMDFSPSDNKQLQQSESASGGRYINALLPTVSTLTVPFNPVGVSCQLLFSLIYYNYQY